MHVERWTIIDFLITDFLSSMKVYLHWEWHLTMTTKCDSQQSVSPNQGLHSYSRSQGKMIFYRISNIGDDKSDDSRLRRESLPSVDHVMSFASLNKNFVFHIVEPRQTTLLNDFSRTGHWYIYNYGHQRVQEKLSQRWGMVIDLSLLSDT